MTPRLDVRVLDAAKACWSVPEVTLSVKAEVEPDRMPFTSDLAWLLDSALGVPSSTGGYLLGVELRPEGLAKGRGR